MYVVDLDVDPFRYTTLSSLRMSIFMNKFLKDKTIVTQGSNKKDSKVCREWLTHMNDDKLIPEIPFVIRKDRLNLEGREFKHYKNNKYTFTVDAMDEKNKTIKEFQGRFWHSCPKCYPDNKDKYEKTLERTQLLD